MCYLTPQTITPESDCSCWTETPTLTTSTPITLTWVFTHTNTHSGYQSRFTQWAKSHLFLLETNYLDVGTIISMRVHYRCSLFYLFLLHRSLISSSISFVPNCFPLLHSSSPIPHVSFHPSISVFPPLLSALGALCFAHWCNLSLTADCCNEFGTNCLFSIRLHRHFFFLLLWNEKKGGNWKTENREQYVPLSGDKVIVIAWF